MPAAFLTTLKTDAENVEKTGQAGVACMVVKEGFTQEEGTTKQALMEKLRKIQSAVRAAYADPELAP